MQGQSATLLCSFGFTLLLGALSSDSVAATESSRSRQIQRPDAPPIGTRIRPRVVSRSIVPIDKTYAELDPEQQQTLKAQYEAIADGDEPPFPANGLRPIYDVLIKARYHLAVTGTLIMNVEVNEKGAATAVSVVHSPHPELTQLAAATLMLQKYKPAVCGGQPCRMGFPFRIEFSKTDSTSPTRNYWQY